MTVGQRIQEHRKKNGLSQEELGQRLLVSRQTVSLWEKDQTLPTVDNLLLLKDIFGISVDELLGKEEEPQALEEKEPKALEKHTFTYEEELLKKMYKGQSSVFLSMVVLFAVATVAGFWLEAPFYAGLCTAATGIMVFLWWNNRKERNYVMKSFPGKTVEVSLYDGELVFATNSDEGTPIVHCIPFDQINTVSVDNFFYHLYHGSMLYLFPVGLFQKGALEPDSRLELLLKSNLPKNKRTAVKGLWRWISFGLVYLCLLSPFLGVLAAVGVGLLAEGEDFLLLDYYWVHYLMMILPLASVAVGIYLRSKKKKATKNIVVGIFCGMILFSIGSGVNSSTADMDRAYAEETFAWAECTLGLVLPETELMLNTLDEETLLEDGFYEFTTVCIAVITPGGRESFEAGLTPEANWLSDLPEEVKAILPFEGGYDHILLYNSYTEEYNCLPAEEGWYFFTCLLYDEETGTVTLWDFSREYVPSA